MKRITLIGEKRGDLEIEVTSDAEFDQEIDTVIYDLQRVKNVGRDDKKRMLSDIRKTLSDLIRYVG